MSLFEFRLPDIGEGVAEGEVVAWHVKVGDQVKEDDAMVEVMTDKAAVVIGAPKSGKIVQLLAKIGDVIKVGDILVVIDTGNGVKLPASGTVSQIPAVVSQREVIVDSSPSVGSPPVVQDGSISNRGGQLDTKGNRPLATPATRKLARDLGIDLRQITSNSGKKITKEDVLAYAGQSIDLSSQLNHEEVKEQSSASDQKRIPFVGVRRLMAERMQKSKNTAAHFTFVEECEVDRLIELREGCRSEAESKGIELNYLPFIVKATVSALKIHPILNSMLDNHKNELVIPEEIHMGIATATEQGLLVPVIRNAQNLNLFEIAREIQRLAVAAHGNELKAWELNGSTFTITSLGKQSGLFATPVINLPNVGILSVHRIKEKPLVRNSQVVTGHVMLLSLSFDHRIVDGQTGAAFAYQVIEYLENPERLL